MRNAQTSRIARDERGTALVEAAIIVPLVLLIMVGIFEVGRAYQTYQVLANAAREGARASVVPSGNEANAREIVKRYMADGQVQPKEQTRINVNRSATIPVNGTNVGASLVTIDYPFDFIVLQPVAKLIAGKTRVGESFTMRATSMMRNESY